jgi:hypothetical protein
MFHTYVLAFSHTMVDFDRASFLMDKDLLQASLDAMRHEQTTCPRWDDDYGARCATPITTASCSGRMSIRIGTPDRTSPGHVTCPLADRPIPGR